MRENGKLAVASRFAHSVWHGHTSGDVMSDFGEALGTAVEGGLFSKAVSRREGGAATEAPLEKEIFDRTAAPSSFANQLSFTYQADQPTNRISVASLRFGCGGVNLVRSLRRRYFAATVSRHSTLTKT